MKIIKIVTINCLMNKYDIFIMPRNELSLKFFNDNAKNGNSDAQLLISYYYQFGYIVKEDLKEVILLL